MVDRCSLFVVCGLLMFVKSARRTTINDQRSTNKPLQELLSPHVPNKNKLSPRVRIQKRKEFVYEVENYFRRGCLTVCVCHYRSCAKSCLQNLSSLFA